MLIVVVIIGILAAALIPRLTSVKDKANDAARKSNIQSIVTAISSYGLDNGMSAIVAGDTFNTAGVKKVLTGGGMTDIPADPSKAPHTILGTSTSGYVVVLTTKNGNLSGGFVVVGFAETAAAANWVEWTTTDFSGGTDISNVKFCDSVTVGTRAAGTPCQGSADKFRIVAKY